jgi:hypothetical protein
VAIEFDTKLDAHFNDPNDHYDLILQDIDLKSEF